MDFTPEQRETIYLEEKARRHKSSKGATLEILLVATAAIVGFAAFVMLTTRPEKPVKLEDLRKAYEGLSPEDEQ
jgi:hypothetical protein